MSIVLGLRPETTRDTLAYIEAFNISESEIAKINFNNLFLKFSNGMETGFWFLSFLFKRLFGSYRLFFIFCSFASAIISIHYLSTMVSDDNEFVDPLVMLLYYLFFGIMYSGIVLRAGLAISLGVASVYYFKNKRIILGLFSLIISFLLHQSSLLFSLFALLALFMRKNAGRRFEDVCLCISVVLLIFAITNFGNYTYSILDNTLSNFLTRIGMGKYYISYGSSTVSIIGIKKTLICACITISMFLMRKSGIETKKFIFLYLLFTSFVIVFFPGVMALSRVFDMALIFIIIPIAKILKKYNNKARISYNYAAYAVSFFLALYGLSTVFPEIIHI